MFLQVAWYFITYKDSNRNGYRYMGLHTNICDHKLIRNLLETCKA